MAASLERPQKHLIFTDHTYLGVAFGGRRLIYPPLDDTLPTFYKAGLKNIPILHIILPHFKIMNLHKDNIQLRKIHAITKHTFTHDQEPDSSLCFIHLLLGTDDLRRTQTFEDLANVLQGIKMINSVLRDAAPDLATISWLGFSTPNICEQGHIMSQTIKTWRSQGRMDNNILFKDITTTLRHIDFLPNSSFLNPISFGKMIAETLAHIYMQGLEANINLSFPPFPDEARTPDRKKISGQHTQGLMGILPTPTQTGVTKCELSEGHPPIVYEQSRTWPALQHQQETKDLTGTPQITCCCQTSVCEPINHYPAVTIQSFAGNLYGERHVALTDLNQNQSLTFSFL